MLSESLHRGISHITVSVPFSETEIRDIIRGAFQETAMGDNNPESEFEGDGQDLDGNDEDDEVMEVSAQSCRGPRMPQLLLRGLASVGGRG